MKLRNILLFALVVLVESCSKDNYDAPSATFSGKISYNGEPINVEYNQVRFQLWEGGYGKFTPIDVPIKQDGTFSSLLFNGKYTLTFPGGQGPYMTVQNGSTKDTLSVDISGNKEMDIEVIPYYMVRNHQFSYNSGVVTGSIKLDQIITDANAKNVDRVFLYLNTTQFVSGAGSAKVAESSVAGSAITDMNNVSLNVNVPSLTRTQNYIFARIGVKIQGVEDMIFSPVVKLEM